MGFASSLLMLGVVPQLLVAAHVLQARQSVSCDFATAANNGDTCASFAAAWGITEDAFAKLNPGVSCPGNLIAGSEYCVIGTVSTTTKAATTSTTPPTTTTTKATTLSTTLSTTSVSPTGPSPQMPSITSTCNKFYQVQSGDGCWSIEQAQGISASDFMAWNKAVDAQCDNLWLGYYVCVGVKGGSSLPPTTTKPASSSAPTPQMPNTVSNCKKFHKVVSGDGCWAIEQAAGISASDFAKWNPYVDAACDNLWLGYYVCIGL
ncbi:hypothetical protein B0T13DRAFT_465759 [Neurospora crassa]|nr:hypothetical protein B0T13DRAFT_465759 [Neurospora crassa]